MAVAARCNLSSSSPRPASSSNTLTATHISWWRSEKWRRRCAVSLASSCMIIGLQMGDAGAVAGERPVTAMENSQNTYMDVKLVAESSGHEKMVSAAKWSDRRMCPSWRTKSFEIIVPENLPRPSAHRRWEDIGFTKQDAPVVKVAVKTNCFSM